MNRRSDLIRRFRSHLVQAGLRLAAKDIHTVEGRSSARAKIEQAKGMRRTALERILLSIEAGDQEVEWWRLRVGLVCESLPAVRFMAETAKVLSPHKTVLDPNPDGGCSLADGINAGDVRRLRKEYPDHTFVCYINTTAEVKALCDVCVTSSNVYKIIQAIDNDNIYFLPDKLMGQNVIDHLEAKGVKKNIAVYDGTCYVHEEYTPEAIDFIRVEVPQVNVLVHPECHPRVVQRADYVGSTSGMLNHVRESDGDSFFLLTECGLTGILQSEFPDKRFVGSCTMCKYMKANSLPAVLAVLENPQPHQIIELSPEVQQRALRCVERMFEYAEPPGKARPA